MKSFLKKYFIPHEGNDYRPHFLRPRTAVILLAWIFAAEFFVLLQAFVIFPKSKMLGVIFPASIVDLTNSNRITQGLQPLAVNPFLQEAAQEKANDMAQKSYFAHTSPDGATPWYWFMKAGYDFSYAGENLAVNFFDSNDVMNAWMNSPEHRANILNGNFKEIGIATATGTYEGIATVFVVQEFGTSAIVAPVVSAAQSAPTRNSLLRSISVPPSAPKAASRPAPVIATVSSTETFAEVKGIAVTALSSTAPSVVSSSVPAIASAPVKSFVPQANPIQTLTVLPHTIFDYALMIVCAILLFALALNIFIKIRFQDPVLITSGISLMVIIGVFIVANQNLFSSLGKIL